MIVVVFDVSGQRSLLDSRATLCAPPQPFWTACLDHKRDMLALAGVLAMATPRFTQADPAGYGPPSWGSTQHQCDRDQGFVWCGGACVLPTVASDGTLPCPPANLALLPAGFAWGSATAAYQIEGAVAEGGAGVIILRCALFIPLAHTCCRIASPLRAETVDLGYLFPHAGQDRERGHGRQERVALHPHGLPLVGLHVSACVCACPPLSGRRG